MKERTIEKHLVDQCDRLDLLCLKMKIEGRRGFPDRAILHEEGQIFFVETKTKAGRLSKQQEETFAELRRRGFEVFVARSFEEINGIVSHIAEDQ